MPDQDKDSLEQDELEQGEPNEFEPGEDEFEEDLEAEEAGVGAPVEPSRPGRRFGLRRGGSEEEEHPQGSVRTSHERVHIDDRASALYVLIAALGLVLILIAPLIAGAIPAGPVPTLPPLNNLQTFTAPPTAPPTPTPSVTPTPTVAPSAS